MKYKILHTADWHIGKKLHDYDMLGVHRQFFDWLAQVVKEEKIDLLLVSGDVFDQANPTNEARSLYYSFLGTLCTLNCKVVITGGNHDSPSMLNATDEILKYLNINVVGNFPVKKEDVLIPLQNQAQNPFLVIAAIPFLRDADIRSFSINETEADRLQQIREGIKNVFDATLELSQKVYPKVPVIAMGHLYVQGASISESEREIQVGNLAGFDVAEFNSGYSYVALGHIHKPQNVSGDNRVVYSGSPLPLSFSETNDRKRIIILEWEGSEFEFTEMEIPRFVHLLQIKGTYEHIEKALYKRLEENFDTDTLIELHMIEEEYSIEKPVMLEQLVESFKPEKARIIKYRYAFNSRMEGTAQIFESNSGIEDLNPQEVFHRKLDAESFDEKARNLLEEAFNEILQEIQQNEG
ncbi:MAG: exonuclease SbcCD subunit D C-terminal domain-containing protein [Cyclobacteriaceae bacterium]|nr:exonuclease SbcCD subunit D C-terminal domain-containing protein [Cyclobacteriaceae bacterium]